MKKIRKERWGILVDGILLPGFDSKEEAEKYIEKHSELRSPLSVKLNDEKEYGCSEREDLNHEDYTDEDGNFWWD